MVAHAGTVRLPPGTEETWDALAAAPRATAVADMPVFDRGSLASLPTPAARWLGRVVPPGTPLIDVVEIEMTGEIKLGPRWMPFTATQILRAGVGFVWKPIVGGRLLRFVGADLLGPDDARMEFRLHGRIPVARAAGPGTARSAAGRLAAETVAWLPQAATPQAGARWSPVDHAHAIVTLEAAGREVDVQVTVDEDGRLCELLLDRWNDSADPPGLQPFGGEVSAEHETAHGVWVAGAGTVGWGYGTPSSAGGVFFRYAVSRVEPPGP